MNTQYKDVFKLFTYDDLEAKVHEIIARNKVEKYSYRYAFDKGLAVGVEAMAEILLKYIILPEATPETINTEKPEE